MAQEVSQPLILVTPRGREDLQALVIVTRCVIN